jgi:hypothetical protein
MAIEDYGPPVDQLLTLGDLRGEREWRDYPQYGLGPEHVPDLIRMATDDELNWGDSESAEVWAPVHAWRALGQLHSEEAIGPLLDQFEPLDDSDWFREDMPAVFSLIGPAAVPALRAYLAEPEPGEWAKVCASTCLAKIGEDHPEARADCVAALMNQLEAFGDNGDILNANLIYGLTELRAEEALPLIERAFAAEVVDLALMGDWEDVQIEFGVKAERDTPRPNYVAQAMGIDPELLGRLGQLVDSEPTPLPAPPPAAETTAAQRRAAAERKAKGKRKAAQQSRRQNRRRR